MSKTAIPKTPVIWEVPQLAIDKKMKEEFNRDVHPRGRMERRLVWNLLAHLANHGFNPVAIDYGDEVEKTPTAMSVMELVFNLDDCHIYFRKEKGGQRWVRIVLGNDGWDSVNDWGYANGDPDGFNAVMEAFDGEDYC